MVCHWEAVDCNKLGFRQARNIEKKFQRGDRQPCVCGGGPSLADPYATVSGALVERRASFSSVRCDESCSHASAECNHMQDAKGSCYDLFTSEQRNWHVNKPIFAYILDMFRYLIFF